MSKHLFISRKLHVHTKYYLDDVQTDSGRTTVSKKKKKKNNNNNNNLTAFIHALYSYGAMLNTFQMPLVSQRIFHGGCR